MRKEIRTRVLHKDEREYSRQWHAKVRRPRMDKEMGRNETVDRECPVDRILGNQAMRQLLTVKLETEGEQAVADFLESLGCSDVMKVMKTIACQ